jgi:OmpA-OmpF porin, OOP family
VSYERLAFTDFKVPLSRLEKAGDDQRDRMNNQVFKPKKEIEIEGARTRIAYLLPAGRSPLEVLRNYQDVVKESSGESYTLARRKNAVAIPSAPARAAAAK